MNSLNRVMRFIDGEEVKLTAADRAILILMATGCLALLWANLVVALSLFP